jgi:peptidoglycan/LPS O-acetylase OafA/YrhL
VTGSTTQQPGADRANLDLLRTFAVLYVLVFHVLLVRGQLEVSTGGVRAALHNLGHLGVLVFFVHTSLVLMFSLERIQQRAPEEGLFGEFMIRRVFRIFPASVMMVLLVVLFRLPVGDFVAGRFVASSFSTTNVIANVLLAQNVTNGGSMIATLWSLPYEMQMYLVLPLLFLGAQRVRSARLAAALWIAAALVARLVSGLGHADRFPFMTYVPDFLAGVLSYRLGALTAARRLRIPWMLFPLALLAVTVPYLARPTLPVAWFTCGLLGALLPHFDEMPEGRLREAMRIVARYSYGIYLTHFVALWYAFAAMARRAEWVRWTVFVGATAAGSAALYHLVEAPFIAAGKKFLDRRRGEELSAA